jgi:hypothetical protein
LDIPIKNGFVGDEDYASYVSSKAESIFYNFIKPVEGFKLALLSS